MAHRRMSVLLLMFWVAVSSSSQTPFPTNDQVPLVLRSSTRLVQVNVIALDQEGNPVADLRAADFSITDDGKAQKISVFSMDKPDPALGRQSNLPPNAFSNHWEDHPGSPTSVTVILLDAVNTNWEDHVYSRQQLQQYLKQLRPNDRVAIFTLGQDLRMLHDFSSDAASLARSLADYRGEIPPNLSPPIPYGSNPSTGPLASRDPLVAGTTRPPSQYSQTDIQNYATEREYESSVYRRAESTIASLSFIANYLGRLPGRKNLVWISGGFPFSFGFDSLRIRPGQSTQGMSNLSQEIERGARALDNANLAIYPIDARGLMTSPVYSPQERVLDFSKGSMVVGENEQATMRELAERTGGRAYFNTNGITEAIRQAEDDSRVSYAMAYYPSLTKWDGKFHRIKVSTSRPGVHLRYRLGYFALPEVAPTDEERKATLEAAVFSPLDATAVPLRARATPEGGSLSILLHVDPSGITLNSERGRWIGSLDLLSEQFSQDGQRLKDKSIKLNLNLKQETYERLQLGGFSYTYPVEVLPEANRIRVVVRDNPSGAIGSLDIKVK